ncbi:hypothetical protein [Endozoicomonas acroporae]|uniref:hypothetical protein n=1 Tax=Endozoicomonas acroporae TaxID=1701104 RepID=UPI0013D43979|nr:hypothetical protein [Endozoicomonas acroporae]
MREARVSGQGTFMLALLLTRQRLIATLKPGAMRLMPLLELDICVQETLPTPRH